jgi:hypothetical protein
MLFRHGAFEKTPQAGGGIRVGGKRCADNLNRGGGNHKRTQERPVPSLVNSRDDHACDLCIGAEHNRGAEAGSSKKGVPEMDTPLTGSTEDSAGIISQ